MKVNEKKNQSRRYISTIRSPDNKIQEIKENYGEEFQYRSGKELYR